MIFKRQQAIIDDLLAGLKGRTPEFRRLLRTALEQRFHDYNAEFNTVGYKRPPKHTRFKKGNPGGPGRPKGDALYCAVIRILAKDDKKALEDIVKGLVERARAGSPRAIKTILYITERRKREIPF